MAIRAEYIWMNGKLIPWDEAQVHVFTHALHYGSSAFEGIRVYETANGPAIFRGREHYERLLYSAKVAAHPLPLRRRRVLAGDHRRRACQQPAQRIRAPAHLPRLQHARRRRPRLPGRGDRRLRAVGRVSGQGRAGEWRRRAGEHLAAHGARHVQHVGQDRRPVRQQPEHRHGSATTALPRASRSTSTATSPRAAARTSSSFSRARSTRRRWPTASWAASRATAPPRSRRNWATPSARRSSQREMLYMADEIFFTGTAAEITPVRSVDRMPVGEGERGPITEQIQARFFGIVEGELPDTYNWLTPVGDDFSRWLAGTAEAVTTDHELLNCKSGSGAAARPVAEPTDPTFNAAAPIGTATHLPGVGS